MQIKGEEFIKKVQLQQEREELERKMNEIEEEMSINNDPVIFSRNLNMNNMNNMNHNDINDIEANDHELNNIMLGTSFNSNEENKKKYLILGIVLVVLFLLTIIIIRLLTNDSNKEDQFTSNNANSSEIKKLSENGNIEENFQKIINERVKKDSSQPANSEVGNSASDKLDNMQHNTQGYNQERETIQEEAPAVITNEALDDTIKKVESKKTSEKQKVSDTVEKKTSTIKETAAVKETAVKETFEKKTEQKKSVKDLVDTQVSSSSNDTSGDISKGGYYVQIGAFTKKPTDSYVGTIRNAKLKYKIYQDTVNGVDYNKVLIGPYSSKAAASENIEDVKQKLNVTSAFVVKF